MGEIAKGLKKAKKKPRKAKATPPQTTKPEEEQQPPEYLALREEARKMANWFARISFDRAVRTCHFCCTEMRSMYDLGFASPYGKCKFCSEECQTKWYTYHGLRLKPKDQALDEEFDI